MDNYYVKYKIGSKFGGAFCPLGAETKWFPDEESAKKWIVATSRKYPNQLHIYDCGYDEMYTAAKILCDAGVRLDMSGTHPECEDEHIVGAGSW